jgi:hypothetical protein
LEEDGTRHAEVACTAADQIRDRAGLRDALMNSKIKAPMWQEREAGLKR